MCGDPVDNGQIHDILLYQMQSYQRYAVAGVNRDRFILRDFMKTINDKSGNHCYNKR
ncbi:hypothetical protein ANACOL_02489 [Anaerotruncus colihominis DSM 17241]|uniref:Uncharacterized protein n=1 Tax=Anaerotruncus colihominis DSM 17241 TaxID=445972 RepID=B0PCI1_9FIRM|nr:hypothetical protein ANACOL_02489 [Anaerotruncus colihominis DSM 17241]